MSPDINSVDINSVNVCCINGSCNVWGNYIRGATNVE